MKRDTCPGNITYPGHAWKIKFTALKVRSHVAGGLFALYPEFSDGCIALEITGGDAGGENRAAAFKGNHTLAGQVDLNLFVILLGEIGESSALLIGRRCAASTAKSSLCRSSKI